MNETTVCLISESDEILRVGSTFGIKSFLLRRGFHWCGNDEDYPIQIGGKRYDICYCHVQGGHFVATTFASYDLGDGRTQSEIEAKSKIEYKVKA